MAIITATMITRPPYTPVPPSEVILNSMLSFENKKYKINVFKDFQCDGGSIPRISWTLLGITPWDPRCVYAFIIHDFLYQSELVTREEADAILYEILCIEPRCNYAQRWLIWSHVRMYGWIVWRGHTVKSRAEGCKFGEVINKESTPIEIIRKEKYVKSYK